MPPLVALHFGTLRYSGSESYLSFQCFKGLHCFTLVFYLLLFSLRNRMDIKIKELSSLVGAPANCCFRATSVLGFVMFWLDFLGTDHILPSAPFRTWRKRSLLFWTFTSLKINATTGMWARWIEEMHHGHAVYSLPYFVSSGLPPFLPPQLQTSRWASLLTLSRNINHHNGFSAFSDVICCQAPHFKHLTAATTTTTGTMMVCSFRCRVCPWQNRAAANGQASTLK